MSNRRHTFIIRAGGVNMTRPEILFETNVFYNHPLFNNNLPSVVQPHDIGLLKFGRSLTFSGKYIVIINNTMIEKYRANPKICLGLN